MQFKTSGSKFLVRLEKDEQIMAALTSFCEQQNIHFGLISGIGGASKVTLGYYNLEEKNYHWQDFSGHLEVLSLDGNVALVDNEPFLHIHIAISDEKFIGFGGHLKEGTVAGTMEVVIEKLEGEVERKIDVETGLNLLALI